MMHDIAPKFWRTIERLLGENFEGEGIESGIPFCTIGSVQDLQFSAPSGPMLQALGHQGPAFEACQS